MPLIIPKNLIAVENNWQKELAQCFTEPQALLEHLGLDVNLYEHDIAARKLFPMRVPRPFVARMRANDPTDPLLQQVFPLRQEFDQRAGFVADPLAEHVNDTPGVLHKYQSRVLLMVRGGCAVNCRYCFRRHFPYQDNSVNRQGWIEALAKVAQDDNINEVIYSGGDPLMAKDDFLAWLTQQIEAIPHIRRLRIHTRLPVVIPSRINAELIEWITATRLQTVIVLHINHPNEIDDKVVNAVQKLADAGVVLFNQAVLLKGVNDSADTLVELSEALFAARIMPYYLHLMDKVEGAAHFDVCESEARQLMAELVKRLPGFLVPKLVREIGGQPGKTPIDLHLHP